MELRRRSETVMEEINMRVRSTALLPHRIRTSSGIVVTGLIVMLLALLFTFRREAAGAFIWLGEQMVATDHCLGTCQLPAAFRQQAARLADSKRQRHRRSDAKRRSQGPEPTRSQVHDAAKATPPTPKDVRSLWNLVAKGDVSAELNWERCISRATE